MSRWILVAVVSALTGCAVDCPSEAHSETGFAPQGVFQNQIDACIDTPQACMRLCMDVFTLDYGSDTVTKCKVVDRSAQGATVHVEYVAEGVCESDDVEVDIPVDTGDDDGSTDDGSGSDDGSTGDDGSGDGSGSDTGSDGGDSGSGDDGSSPRHTSGAVHVHQGTNTAR